MICICPCKCDVHTYALGGLVVSRFHSPRRTKHSWCFCFPATVEMPDMSDGVGHVIKQCITAVHNENNTDDFKDCFSHICDFAADVTGCTFTH